MICIQQGFFSYFKAGSTVLRIEKQETIQIEANLKKLTSVIIHAIKEKK